MGFNGLLIISGVDSGKLCCENANFICLKDIKTIKNGLCGLESFYEKILES